MLQLNSLDFQGFQLVRGYSTRHETRHDTPSGDQAFDLTVEVGGGDVGDADCRDLLTLRHACLFGGFRPSAGAGTRLNVRAFAALRLDLLEQFPCPTNGAVADAFAG